MRALVQRVSRSSVSVEGKTVGEIGPGLTVLIGVSTSDGPSDVQAIADKLVGLRIFRDDEGKMNRSIGDVGGDMLVISQFTLYGDARRGRRPSFTAAAPPELAEPLVEQLVGLIAAAGITTATGSFGAMMDVEIHNDGPVTLMLETRDGKFV